MSEIRELPAVEARVETGPVQFGNDWPGLFIRGDNAFGLSLELLSVESTLSTAGDERNAATVRRVRELLLSCNTCDAVHERFDGE